ncbi:hypothetical protein PSRE111525_26455 [Pseudomonas reidholzensis]
MAQPRHAGDPLGDLALWRRCRTQPTQVALHIRRKHRHARITEDFGQVLQGHRLAGTGGTGHQAMAVGQAHGLAHWLTVSTRT